MNNIAEILFSLIRYELFGVEYDRDRSELNDEKVLDGVCSLAAFHGMTHLIADALGRLSVIPTNEKLASALSREQLKAIFISERIDGELDSLCRLFEEKKIEYIPLKGAVIRELYPEKWMRTSCDIDILVRRKDLEKAISAVREELGYKYLGTGNHDAGLVSPTGIHFELHYTLMDEGRSNRTLDEVWKHTHTEGDSKYRLYMDDDIFYLYHISHMAKHIINGGCGIKPLLDLHFIRYCGEDMLKEHRYEKFSQIARKLSDVWCKGEKHDDLTKQLEAFILRGGTNGNLGNAIAVGQIKRGGKVKYVLSRIFLPYNSLKYYYPVIQKHKWLFPFCQVMRWYKLVFRDSGVKRFASELKTSANLSDEQTNSVDLLLSELDLSKVK